MPTTVTSTIKKTAGDYSSAQAWEDAAPANLVTDDKVWKGEMYGVNDEWDAAGATWLTISGSTSDATRYKWLTAATGESFADHANKLTNALRYNPVNGVAVKGNSGNYAGTLLVDEDNVLIERLQLKLGGPPGGYTAAIVLNNTCLLRGMILEKYAATSYMAVALNAGAPKLVNCLIRGSISGSAIRGVNASNYITSAQQLISNCTIVKDSSLTDEGEGAHVGVTSYIVKNTAVFGPFDAFVGSFHANSGYNASDDNDCPGSNNQNSAVYASQFEDVDGADADFRVKTGADLINNGTRDQTYTNDLDIVGQSRSTTTPTIGAWEVVAGGASVEGGGMLLSSRRNRLTIP